METKLSRAEFLRKILPGFVKEKPIQGDSVPAGAYIDEGSCLAYQKTLCRYCVDACPESAITLEGLRLPVIDEEKCNYCGNCVPVCIGNALKVSQGLPRDS